MSAAISNRYTDPIRPARVAKLSAVVLLFLIGLWLGSSLLNPIRYQASTKLDFLANYLVAKTILAGEYPYQSLRDLASKNNLPISPVNLPNPHPPPELLVIAPLGLFSYSVALAIWLAVSGLALAVSLKVVLGLRVGYVLIAVPVALVWYPILADLGIGQVMCIELCFLSLAWKHFRKNQDTKAGLILGWAVTMKLIIWPVVLFMLLKKRFRAALFTIGVVFVCNLIAALALGFGTVKDYYLRAGPQVAAYYKSDTLNFSVFTIGERVVAGTKSTMTQNLGTDPFIRAPQFARLISVIMVAGVLLAGMYLIARCGHFDLSFAATVALSLLLSPTTWWYYSTLLAIPICIAYKQGFRYVLLPMLIAPVLPLIVGTGQFGFWHGLLFAAPLLGPISALAACLKALRRHY